MSSALPVRKVSNSGAAGALATLLVYILNGFVLPKDQLITPEIAAALVTVLTLTVGYFVSPAAGERVIEDPTPATS